MCGVGATSLLEDTLYTHFSPGMLVAHLLTAAWITDKRVPDF